MTNKRNLSVPEYCSIYGVSRSIAYRDMKSGDLRFIKHHDRTLIPVEFAEERQRKLMEAAGSNKAA